MSLPGKILGALAGKLRTIAGDKSWGSVDGWEIEPAGVARVIGWEVAPGRLADLVDVRLDGKSVAPLSVSREFRPDVAAFLHSADPLHGVLLEYLIVPRAQATRLELFVDGKLRRTKRLPPADLPPYPHLLAGTEVFGDEQIYAIGPPVDAVDPLLLDFARLLPEPILDVGCGTGAVVAALRAEGKNAVGIEVDTPRNRAGVPAERRDWVRFYDGGRLPFADREFAGVSCFEVLEVTRAFEELTAEIARVCSERAVITVPDFSGIALGSAHGIVPWHVLGLDNVAFFTPRNLAALAQRHFRKVDVVRFAVNPLNGSRIHMHVGVVCGA